LSFEEYYLLECDAMQPGRSLPTFLRNILPPSSCLKNELEDGDCIFLLNISTLLLDYTASHPKIKHSSKSLLILYFILF
jgi:hypothetical protein